MIKKSIFLFLHNPRCGVYLQVIYKLNIYSQFRGLLSQLEPFDEPLLFFSIISLFRNLPTAVFIYLFFWPDVFFSFQSDSGLGEPDSGQSVKDMTAINSVSNLLLSYLSIYLR